MIVDKLAHLRNTLEYNLGTLIAKFFIRNIGRKNKIHFSVKYWLPSKIELQSNCEIRNGVFIDARSTKNVGVSIGEGTRVKDCVGLAAYGGQIRIGKKVLIGRGTTIFGHGGVYIGDNTMIGPNTAIISSDHIAYIDERPFQEQGFTREAIYIDENVWIGANVCILSGSNISSNVVIAAGSVVKGKLEGGWLYAGIPAKQIKQLENSRPDGVEIYTRDWDLLS